MEKIVIEIRDSLNGSQATKRKRGRSQEREWPEPIPDTPENIARAVLSTPPKKPDEWRHLQDADDDG